MDRGPRQKKPTQARNPCHLPRRANQSVDHACNIRRPARSRTPPPAARTSVNPSPTITSATPPDFRPLAWWKASESTDLRVISPGHPPFLATGTGKPCPGSPTCNLPLRLVASRGEAAYRRSPVGSWLVSDSPGDGPGCCHRTALESQPLMRMRGEHETLH
jgi:hypothetical protein